MAANSSSTQTFRRTVVGVRSQVSQTRAKDCASSLNGYSDVPLYPQRGSNLRIRNSDPTTSARFVSTRALILCSFPVAMCWRALHAPAISRNAQSVRGQPKPSKCTRRETCRDSTAILVEMTSCVVQLVSGKMMSFELASVATVWHLKELIKRAVDGPKRQQRLLDGTREVTNHSPLNCCDRLTLVIIDAKCQVCGADASAPQSLRWVL